MKEEKIIDLYLNYTLLNCMYLATITQVSITMNEEIEKYKEQFENTLDKLEKSKIKCDAKAMSMYKKFYDRSFKNIHAYDHLLVNSMEKPTAPLIEKQVKYEFREEFSVISEYNKKLLHNYFPDITNVESTPFANKISSAAYRSDYFLTKHIDAMLMDKWSFDNDGAQFDVRKEHKAIFDKFDNNLDDLNVESVKENDIEKRLVAKEITKYTGKKFNNIEENKEKEELKELLKNLNKTEQPKKETETKVKKDDYKVVKKEKKFKSRRFKFPTLKLNINPYVFLFIIPLIVCALTLLFSELGWFTSGDNFFVELNKKVNFVDGYGKWAEGIQDWLQPALEDIGTIQGLLAFVLILPLTLVAYVLEGVWWLISWAIIGIIKLLIFLIGKIIFIVPLLLYGGGVTLDVIVFTKSDEKDTSMVIGFIVSLLLCLTLGVLMLI